MMNDQLRAAIEEDLSVNKYLVDEQEAHLRVKDMDTCRRCEHRPCVFICPAAVYVWEEDRLLVQYRGCLECAACRFVCPHDNIEWNYPRGGFGVVIQQG
jgi:ferredoxin like protein